MFFKWVLILFIGTFTTLTFSASLHSLGVSLVRRNYKDCYEIEINKDRNKYMRNVITGAGFQLVMLIVAFIAGNFIYIIKEPFDLIINWFLALILIFILIMHIKMLFELYNGAVSRLQYPNKVYYSSARIIYYVKKYTLLLITVVFPFYFET